MTGYPSSRAARHILGVAAGVPALTTALLPHAADALAAIAGHSPTLSQVAALGLVAVLLAGVAVTLSFSALAVGADRPGPWRLGWVVALAAVGVVAAPVFWWRYVRPEPDPRPAPLRVC